VKVHGSCRSGAVDITISTPAESVVETSLGAASPHATLRRAMTAARIRVVVGRIRRLRRG
jgi:hypothetical protein